MHITFRYLRLDHSPALEEKAEKKLASVGHLVAGYDDPRVVVEFEKTTEHHKGGDIYHVRMQLFLNGKEINADAVGDDIYTLVDKVRDTLHGAVQRYKEKEVDIAHRGSES